MAPNLVLRLPPMPLTAPMIASEIPAAIRPYSMAVAPDSSFRKRTKSLDIANHLLERRFDHASQELQLSKIDCSKATEIARRTNGATAPRSMRRCAMASPLVGCRPAGSEDLYGVPESDGIVYRSPLNENACCDDSQQALWCVTAQTAGFEPDKWLIRGWSAGRSCGCA